MYVFLEDENETLNSFASLLNYAQQAERRSFQVNPARKTKRQNEISPEQWLQRYFKMFL